MQVALGKIRAPAAISKAVCWALILIGLKLHQTSDAPASFQRQGKGAQNGAVFLLPGLGQCPATLFYPGLCSKNRDEATPELLELSQEILNPAPDQAPLVLADSEHYTTELLDHVHLETPFELLVPMPPQYSPKLHDQARSSERFNRRWAGYATAKEPFRLKQSRCSEPYYRFVQRNGERPEGYYFEILPGHRRP